MLLLSLFFFECMANDYTLVIKNITENDQANYTCGVYNYAGVRFTRPAMLTVFGKCLFFLKIYFFINFFSSQKFNPEVVLREILTFKKNLTFSKEKHSHFKLTLYFHRKIH